MNCSEKTFTHMHHIIPRYMGGRNTKDNLVEVTVTQHAMYHFCNYKLWGNDEDYIAWRGLSGIIDKEQILNETIKLSLAKAIKVAKTPEAIAKKKKKLKEIKHQQGKKNSQYGTKWIYNLKLRENKKIDKDSYIPEGWKAGRIENFDSYFETKKRKSEKKLKNKIRMQEIRNEKIKFYENWYEIYRNTDFKTFCKLTSYSKSQQNLCSKFKEYVEIYSPRATNGK